MSLTEQQDPMSTFLYALKAPESRRQYPRRFKIFLDFLKLEGTIEEQAIEFLTKARQKPQWAQDNLMRFIAFQIQRAMRKEIAESTISNYYKATKLFCEMNDLSLSWNRIRRGLPRGRRAANDRAPTIEEIQKLVEYPDRRIKSIIYTMASSGIRVGAWDYLQWKHVTRITNNLGEVITAKLIIYPGDHEEYYTFITPEAYNALKEWIDFRMEYGERITDDSWLMRDLWQTTNINNRAKSGLATYPKKLKSSGIKRMIERALWEQGIRHTLTPGAKRHEWKAAHGFRKFYKSRTEQIMRPINVEITMGHDIGISASYYKPTEREVLEDYLKAIDILTINGDKTILQKQVTELKEKSQDNEYIIKSKLEKKDTQVRVLQEKYEKDMKSMREEMNEQFSQIMSMIQQNPKLAQIKPEILTSKKIENAG
jgi:hypothetical protein